MKNQILKNWLVAVILAILLPIKAFGDEYFDHYAIIDILEGETKTLYVTNDQLFVMLNSSDQEVVYWNWTKNNDNISIISNTMKSCTIKGVNGGEASELKFKVHMFDGYWVRFYDLEYIYQINVRRDVKVSNISISPSPVFLTPNDNLQLTATVYPSDAFKKDVTWKSSAPDIVTVSSTGLLTAKAYGTATITCSATDGSYVKETCEVTVADKVPVTGITLSKTSLNLGIGDGQYIYASIAPKNTTCTDFTWESSNTSVATVNAGSTAMEDGTYRTYIKSKSLGSTTITCTANDGSGVKATCTVNVYQHGNNSYFVEKSVEGINIKYYVEDAASGTCVVDIAGCNEYGSVDDDITGTVTIPSEAGGYKVVQIGKTGRLVQAVVGRGITQVKLPNSVEKIENNAFRDGLITSIALDHVKHLGNQVFYGCSSLTKITGITNLEYIGASAFKNTPWYDKLPNGPLYLGKVLHEYKGGASSGTELTIPEGIVSISPNAFYDPSSSGLTSISIPKSMTNLSYQSLRFCSLLNKIVVADGNETYDSRNGCNSIIETKSNTLIVGCRETVIPETVKAIGERAFEMCPKQIIIPNSIDSIADGAFQQFDVISSGNNTIKIGSGLRKIGIQAFPSYADSIIVSADNPYFDSRDNCNAIIERGTDKLVLASKSTTIPYSVRAIGTQAYGWLNGQASIRIHDGIKTIEERAFYSYYLRSVTIGRNVKAIGNEAFSHCSNLNSVHSLIMVPFTIDESVFKNTKATLYVPKGSMINYMATEGWADFEKIVEIDDDVLMDGERFKDETIEGIELTYVVKDCVNKTSELVESPSTIEDKVTIPEKAKGYEIIGIGERTFQSRNIREIEIPSSVKSIGQYAFSRCWGLERVISKIENPFAINDNVFHTTSATLYVPIGTKVLYEQTEGWKNFKNIVEGEPIIDPDGIVSVPANDTKNTIFNLSGQRVAAPRKGIYIMDGKKVIVK